ncbi:hypothetical protein L195_g047065, partial [Trifolium pratense]
MERLSFSSDDLFDHISLSFEVSDTPPHIAQALPQLEAPSEAAATQPLPLVERKYRLWLTDLIVVLYAAILIVAMGINNCPKHTYPTKACFHSGRFTFQPTDQNPLFSPSHAT